MSRRGQFNPWRSAQNQVYDHNQNTLPPYGTRNANRCRNTRSAGYEPTQTGAQLPVSPQTRRQHRLAQQIQLPVFVEQQTPLNLKEGVAVGVGPSQQFDAPPPDPPEPENQNALPAQQSQSMVYPEQQRPQYVKVEAAVGVGLSQQFDAPLPDPPQPENQNALPVQQSQAMVFPKQQRPQYVKVEAAVGVHLSQQFDAPLPDSPQPENQNALPVQQSQAMVFPKQQRPQYVKVEAAVGVHLSQQFDAPLPDPPQPENQNALPVQQSQAMVFPKQQSPQYVKVEAAVGVGLSQQFDAPLPDSPQPENQNALPVQQSEAMVFPKQQSPHYVKVEAAVGVGPSQQLDAPLPVPPVYSNQNHLQPVQLNVKPAVDVGLPEVSRRKRPPRLSVQKQIRLIKRRRINAILKRLVAPKNAVTVLNEIRSGLKINVLEEGGIHYAEVEVDGDVIGGTGWTKADAKLAVSEMALKALVLKTMASPNVELPQQSEEGLAIKAEEGLAIKAEDTVQKDLSLADSGAIKDEDDQKSSSSRFIHEDSSSSSSGPSGRQFICEDSLPWGSVASFAIHKLLETWQSQGTAATSGLQLEANKHKAQTAQAGPPAAKKILVDSSRKNPVGLLNELRPNMHYVEIVQGYRSSPAFKFCVNVDGLAFEGVGSSKKQAKRLCAKQACEYLGYFFSD